MPDALTETLKITQEIEQRLVKRYGAEGRGLHTLLDSIDGRLPEPLVRRIRKIATIRNQAVHEDVTKAEEALEEVREANEYITNALLYSEPALMKIASTLDRLNAICAETEDLMAKQYGASGQGLIEKLGSVRRKIDPGIQKLIRELNSYRTGTIFKDVTTSYRHQTTIEEIAEELRTLIPNDVRKRREKKNADSANRRDVPKSPEDEDAAIKIDELVLEIEDRLSARYDAQGRGLKRKFESVREKLPNALAAQVEKVVKALGWLHAAPDASPQSVLKTAQTARDYLLDAFLYKDPAVAKLQDAITGLEETVRRLEDRLVKDFGAKGQNLGKKFASVKRRFPVGSLDKALALADILNKARNVDFTHALRNAAQSKSLAAELEKILDNPIPAPKKSTTPKSDSAKQGKKKAK